MTSSTHLTILRTLQSPLRRSFLPPWPGALICVRSSFVPHWWQKIRPSSLSKPHFWHGNIVQSLLDFFSVPPDFAAPESLAFVVPASFAVAGVAVGALSFFSASVWPCLRLSGL